MPISIHRRYAPRAPPSGVRKLRLRPRPVAKKATTTTAAATATANATAVPEPKPAAATPAVPMAADDADAEAEAHSLDQPRPRLTLLPLELFFAVTDLLPNSSLAALALASSSVHGVLRERLYERFKKSTFWWEISLTDSPNRRFKPRIEIGGPVQWAATHGRAALLGRLLAEMDVLPPPLLQDLQGSSPRHQRWGVPSLLSRAALSGDEAIMRLLLAHARQLPGVDLATPLRFCSNQRMFRLLADEASYRLKALGFG